MSYENPKYINTSNADLFQKMQDKIDSAVLTSKKTIAAENYKKNIINNQNIVEAGNASANFIKDMNANDYGGKFNQGVVSGFYDTYEGPDGEITTWAERAKNITMQMNQSPKPENYGELAAELEFINSSPDIRYPVLAGTLHNRAGTARHDAVAWGYARGADAMGVDIIQNCEVKGIKRNGDQVEGIETTKGFIKSKKIGVVAAGHSSVLANMAGIRLPLESKPLQALVSEPVKPIIDTVVMSNAVHAYVSQSDKGELVIGAGTDSYVSYTQKGSHNIVEETLRAILELYPIFSRMKMLRQWGGIVDICPDASPIISKTQIKGLYFNCGWGTGGFKATPGSGDLFAHTIANDEPHKLNAAFNLNRFVSGDLVDEHGAAAVAH